MYQSLTADFKCMNLVTPVEQAGEHMFARLTAGTRCAKASRHVGPGARQFARAWLANGIIRS
jgi:hypothetical protein